jgi:hypothetical protein
MALQPFVGLWPLFQFLNLYTVGRTPWTGEQPVAGPIPTQRTTQTQNKRTHISMPRVGFEPTIPVFERAKTVHGFDAAATVIGYGLITLMLIKHGIMLPTLICLHGVLLFQLRDNIYSYFNLTECRLL